MEVDPEIVAKAIRDNPTSIAAAARQAGMSRQSVYYQIKKFDAPKRAYQETQAVRDEALRQRRLKARWVAGTKRTVPATEKNITLQDDTWDALSNELEARGFRKGFNWLIEEIVREALGLEPPEIRLKELQD